MGRTVVIGGNANNSPSNAATNYHSITRRNTVAWTATENDARQVIPFAGRISTFRVSATVAPGTAGSGAASDLTVRINGAFTSLTVQLFETATQAFNSDIEITVAAGDVVTLESIPTSTPATAGLVWTLDFEPNSDRFLPFVSGSVSLMSTTAVNHNVVGGGAAWAANTAGNINRQEPIVGAGTLRDIYVLLSGAPGFGSNYNFKALINGASSGVGPTITNVATSGSDTSNTAAVAVNDLLNLQVTPSALPPTTQAAYWGAIVLADKDNQCYVLGGSSTLLVAGTFYNAIQGHGSIWNAVEGRVKQLSRACRISNLYVVSGQALDGGQTLQFTLMKNNAATALTATIPGAGTTASDTTNFIEVDDFDSLSVQGILSAGTSQTFSWGFLIEPLYPFPNANMMTGMGV